MILLKHVATIQYLNYSRQEFKKAQFTVYIPDTHVTLKQSQGYQTYSENADPSNFTHESKSPNKSEPDVHNTLKCQRCTKQKQE